ncbi:hypothetical protein BDK51DRAFT_31328, partial [Blyttiomyces helicus]
HTRHSQTEEEGRGSSQLNAAADVGAMAYWGDIFMYGDASGHKTTVSATVEGNCFVTSGYGTSRGLEASKYGLPPPGGWTADTEREHCKKPIWWVGGASQREGHPCHPPRGEWIDRTGTKCFHWRKRREVIPIKGTTRRTRAGRCLELDACKERFCSPSDSADQKDNPAHIHANASPVRKRDYDLYGHMGAGARGGLGRGKGGRAIGKGGGALAKWPCATIALCLFGGCAANAIARPIAPTRLEEKKKKLDVVLDRIGGDPKQAAFLKIDAMLLRKKIAQSELCVRDSEISSAFHKLVVEEEHHIDAAGVLVRPAFCKLKYMDDDIYDAARTLLSLKDTTRPASLIDPVVVKMGRGLHQGAFVFLIPAGGGSTSGKRWVARQFDDARSFKRPCIGSDSDEEI